MVVLNKSVVRFHLRTKQLWAFMNSVLNFRFGESVRRRGRILD